ncbi:hypothetical protein, partial [Caldalkalibacillus salinus]|uniref:hypothetical protein n=1 Tax=Caldalkalibacillus salinus TaxID=2803787 RepID=UPI001923690F
MLRQLDELGVSKSFLEQTKHLDNNGLESLVNLVNRGYNETQLRQLLNDGFKLDDILYFANRNIDPNDYARYGIINRTEATWVKRYIQAKGFSPENMRQLVEKKVYPSELERLRVNRPSQVDNFIEALQGGGYCSIQLEPFQETLDQVLRKNDVSLEEFNRIRRTSIDKLTDEELEKIIRVRLDAEFPEPTTIMQKVIKPSDYEHYFSGKYNIRGFITRAQDVKHLDTPEEII